MFSDYLNGMNYVICLIYIYLSSDKGNVEITLVRVWREKSSPDDIMTVHSDNE